MNAPTTTRKPFCKAAARLHYEWMLAQILAEQAIKKAQIKPPQTAIDGEQKTDCG